MVDDYRLLPEIFPYTINTDADLPTPPPNRQLLIWAIKEGLLYFVAEDMTWVSISGGGGTSYAPLPLSVATDYTVSAGEQEVSAEVEIPQSGGTLIIESGSILRFVS